MSAMTGLHMGEGPYSMRLSKWGEGEKEGRVSEPQGKVDLRGGLPCLVTSCGSLPGGSGAEL